MGITATWEEGTPCDEVGITATWEEGTPCDEVGITATWEEGTPCDEVGITVTWEEGTPCDEVGIIVTWEEGTPCDEVATCGAPTCSGEGIAADEGVSVTREEEGAEKVDTVARSEGELTDVVCSAVD